MSNNYNELSDQPKIRRGRPSLKNNKYKHCVSKPIQSNVVKESVLCLHFIDTDNEQDKTSEIINTTEISSEDSEKSTIEISSLTSDKLISIIKQQNIELENYKKKSLIPTSKYSSKLIKNITTYPNDLKLFHLTNNQLFLTNSTDICCWWCTEQFKTLPCFLPDHILNDTFYVFGCFCSYNCAYSYNIYTINDSYSTDRTRLLFKLTNIIFGSNHKLTLAPQREVLQKFGGPLSSEDFHNESLMCSIIYKINIPPIIPLVSTISEIPTNI